MFVINLKKMLINYQSHNESMGTKIRLHSILDSCFAFNLALYAITAHLDIAIFIVRFYRFCALWENIGKLDIGLAQKAHKMSLQ